MTRGEKGFAIGCLFAAMALGTLGTSLFESGLEDAKKNSQDTSVFPTRTLATVNESVSVAEIAGGIGFNSLALCSLLTMLATFIPGSKNSRPPGASVV